MPSSCIAMDDATGTLGRASVMSTTATRPASYDQHVRKAGDFLSHHHNVAASVKVCTRQICPVPL